MAKTQLASYIKTGVIGLALVFGVASCQNKMTDVEDGRDYLQGKGYTQVEGGDNWSYFNWCGKSTLSRDYTVTTQDGTSGVEKTVCFSIIGKHEPMF